MSQNDFIRGSRAIAEEMGVSQHLVLDMARDGVIPAFRKGTTLMASKATLYRWMSAIEAARSAISARLEAEATMKACVDEARAFEQIYN